MFSVIATIILSIMFYNMIMTNRELNDLIYQRAELVPISRAELQTYSSLKTKITNERFITNTVDTIYAGVLKSAIKGSSGYMYSPNFDTDVYPYSVMPDIVLRVQNLFPDSSVSTVSIQRAVIVQWDYKFITNGTVS
jgi:hypothetical protein